MNEILFLWILSLDIQCRKQGREEEWEWISWSTKKRKWNGEEHK